MPLEPALPIAVLISGQGTTLRNLLQQKRDGLLPVAIPLVISSHAKALGLQLANQANAATRIFEKHRFESAAAYSHAVFGACREHGVQLVVMAGFLKHVLIPDDFVGRVMNIHPSLIPAFCGQGYYGGRVHQAVLDYGVKVSGCTVHFVDNQYDHGPIILQRCVPVLDDDSTETLAARVFQAECLAYPEAIRMFVANQLEVRGRRVHIYSPP